LRVASMVMLFNTAAIGLFAVISMWIICRASLLARDPVPVFPQQGTRVAFLTTIVPSQEPIAMVRRTLEAALRVRHDGPIDVWLLDEGDDPEVKETCSALGVRHFSRHGIERWNQPTGPFKARTKHGNYNAWLFSHGVDYDFLVSVDSDHVPIASMAERLLGYFRDPDVAYVVGPQVYGNSDQFISRCGESQQFVFQSLLQRASNAGGIPMLVGTNNAMRIEALVAIGGLKDSVTEDLATSIAVHSTRNPKTGRRFRSVYTPDLLAVGEGPTTFTDYFIQQGRWALGAIEVILVQFPRSVLRLGPRRAIHYAQLLTYYPTSGLAWMLGVTSGLIYLILGVGGLTVSPHLWLLLYFDGAALQIGLYFWNRRHSISPHEEEGSPGLNGLFISALSAPIYAAALFAGLRRRRTAFAVTPKGDARSRDSTHTFRLHFMWAAPIIPGFVIAGLRGHINPWMAVWSVLSLVVCLVPIAMWWVGRLRARGTRLRRARSTRPRRGRQALESPAHPLVATTEASTEAA
ncbi:MAG: glycosyltransferase, partial [Solirubrobacteraceae bacterium]